MSLNHIDGNSTALRLGVITSLVIVFGIYVIGKVMFTLVNAII